MSKYIPGNQKHLTLDDRIYIENELNKGTSFKEYQNVVRIFHFLCHPVPELGPFILCFHRIRTKLNPFCRCRFF